MNKVASWRVDVFNFFNNCRDWFDVDDAVSSTGIERKKIAEFLYWMTNVGVLEKRRSGKSFPGVIYRLHPDVENNDWYYNLRRASRNPKDWTYEPKARKKVAEVTETRNAPPAWGVVWKSKIYGISDIARLLKFYFIGGNHDSGVENAGAGENLARGGGVGF